MFRTQYGAAACIIALAWHAQQQVICAGFWSIFLPLGEARSCSDQEVLPMTRGVADTHAAMISSTRLRWGRIIGGAFLLELVLVILLVPPLRILGADKVIPFVYPAVLVLGFAVTWWILRRVGQRTVLHAALIGVLATVIYILLCLTDPNGLRGAVNVYGMFGFIAGNALRIVGCTAGGYVVRKS
jgi:hypothetical protein